MAARNINQNKFKAFFNGTTWKVLAFGIPTVISAATFYVVYNKIPDEIATLIKNINETHTNVENIACNLKDKIEGGQDISVGISSRATDGQAILLKNSGLSYVEGQSIVLHNQGSTYKPRIKLLITAIEEPSTLAEKEGKIQMYINKNAVSMLDYNPKNGTKKLKIMEFKNGSK